MKIPFPSLSVFRSILSAVAALVLLPVTGFAAEPEASPQQIFHVDAERGDDANSGENPEQAVRTLGAVWERLKEVPEGVPVTLRLARGSVWRETYVGRQYPPGTFGRDLLSVEPYGEGDKPTLSSLDILPNDQFQRHDPQTYPHVWSQTLVPPESYHVSGGPRPGVVVNGRQSLARVYPPLESPQRDIRERQPGIETPEDALAFVNANPGSFYAQDVGDGAVTYFINSGSNPAEDGQTYEYKVRGAFFTGENNHVKDIRYIGVNHRDGVAAKLQRWSGVEVLLGDTHNVFVPSGILEDSVSVGSNPPSELTPFGRGGYCHTAFHTHGRDATTGIVYDRCVARDALIAFYDHHAEANRPVVVLRDCVTENVNSVLGHGSSTAVSYVVGHRHGAHDGNRGRLGSMAEKENYVEDSVFRFRDTGAWVPVSRHLRARNSVFHVTGAQPPLAVPSWADWIDAVDYEYDHCTLIIDLEGGDLEESRLRQLADRFVGGRVVFRNSIIAVVNAAGMCTAVGEEGFPLKFGFDDIPADVEFENCVVTYFEDLPPTVAGEGYVVVDAADIFVGNPAEGDFSLRADGIAAKRDIGYREGREPLLRRQADAQVEQVARRMAAAE